MTDMQIPRESIVWKGLEIPRFVLGTVQLGMTYGIANTTGQPCQEKANDLVRSAWKSGVGFFDTAQAYGESETALGLAVEKLGISGHISVITKLTPKLDPLNEPGIRASLEESLRKLRVPQVWAVLLHQSSWLNAWNSGLGRLLIGLRSEGKIRWLGVSVYTVDEAIRALEHPDIDVVQIPCNAWDQRMVEYGVLERARNTGKICFVRSIFLQGLMNMSIDRVASRLPEASNAVSQWTRIVAELGITPREAAVRYALSLQSPLVIGAETAEQVADTADLLKKDAFDSGTVAMIREKMKSVLTDSVLNPASWTVRQ